MIIGIPKEFKEFEYRVACDKDGVKELTSRGDEVLVQKGAGLASGFPDEDYKFHVLNIAKKGVVQG